MQFHFKKQNFADLLIFSLFYGLELIFLWISLSGTIITSMLDDVNI